MNLLQVTGLTFDRFELIRTLQTKTGALLAGSPLFLTDLDVGLPSFFETKVDLRDEED